MTLPDCLAAVDDAGVFDPKCDVVWVTAAEAKHLIRAAYEAGKQSHRMECASSAHEGVESVYRRGYEAGKRDMTPPCPIFQRGGNMRQCSMDRGHTGPCDWSRE
jgi:hypothetical protein